MAKSLQEQFSDLLSQYDYASCCVDDAQSDFDDFSHKTVLDSTLKVYKSFLNHTKKELRHSFDAIAQFCLDHRDSIKFDEEAADGQDQTRSD